MRFPLHQTLVWFHIPKTAGTSLVAEIGRFAVPWAHVVSGVFSPEHDKVIGNARDDLREKKSAALDGVYRIMIGHLTQRDFFSAIGRHERFRYATMLRDPIERICSEYRYITTSPSQPNRAYFTRRYPTFDAYVDQLVDGNVMTHYLEEYRGEPVARIVDRLLEAFAFVGTVATYDADLRMLRDCFGGGHAPSFHLNASPAAALTVSPGSKAKIQARNERDMDLYGSFMARRNERRC